MARVADCGFRRYLGTGKSLSFVSTHTIIPMHIVLIILGIVWFAFLAPPKVVAITAVGCFLIAASVKTIVSTTTGMQVSYLSSIKAVFLSTFLVSIALLMPAGGFTHFTFAFVLALNPVVVPASLLGAYILGFDLCLPISFGASALVAFLSTIASVAIIYGLKVIV